jgi:hypothetical protein
MWYWRAQFARSSNIQYRISGISTVIMCESAEFSTLVLTKEFTKRKLEG